MSLQLRYWKINFFSLKNLNFYLFQMDLYRKEQLDNLSFFVLKLAHLAIVFKSACFYPFLNFKLHYFPCFTSYSLFHFFDQFSLSLISKFNIFCVSNFFYFKLKFTHLYVFMKIFDLNLCSNQRLMNLIHCYASFICFKVLNFASAGFEY